MKQSGGGDLRKKNGAQRLLWHPLCSNWTQKNTTEEHDVCHR